MTIDEDSEVEKRSAWEIKDIELQELLKKYTNKEEKLTIEEISCKIGFGENDDLNFNQQKEIKLMEWKDILKVNLIFLSLLVLICFYDLLTLEQQIRIPLIQLTVLGGLIVGLFILFLVAKRKNTLVFMIGKDGITKDNKLYEWELSNVLHLEKEGKSYLLIKKIHEEEITISLYFMRQFGSRIICWAHRYKKHHETISKREHSN